MESAHFVEGDEKIRKEKQNTKKENFYKRRRGFL